jgi:hypothetical protein
MDIPEVAMTSPNAPSMTHRWTEMTVFADEVANARIGAGFHYRFSMGLQIGDLVVKNLMQSASIVGAR